MSEMDLINNVIPRTDVIKCTARIGAEIRNIKLSADLPDQTISAINGLVLEHKVIFFRDQGHLDDAEQERSALSFGKPSPYPEGTTPIFDIDSALGDLPSDMWHIDWSCTGCLSQDFGAARRCGPPGRGDTVWSNTAAAYLDLPLPLQRLADDLWAVHSFPSAFKKLHAEVLNGPYASTP